MIRDCGPDVPNRRWEESRKPSSPHAGKICSLCQAEAPQWHQKPRSLWLVWWISQAGESRRALFFSRIKGEWFVPTQKQAERETEWLTRKLKEWCASTPHSGECALSLMLYRNFLHSISLSVGSCLLTIWGFSCLGWKCLNNTCLSAPQSQKPFPLPLFRTQQCSEWMWMDAVSVSTQHIWEEQLSLPRPSCADQPMWDEITNCRVETWKEATPTPAPAVLFSFCNSESTTDFFLSHYRILWHKKEKSPAQELDSDF